MNWNNYSDHYSKLLYMTVISICIEKSLIYKVQPQKQCYSGSGATGYSATGLNVCKRETK